jgi:hypothetical protein
MEDLNYLLKYTESLKKENNQFTYHRDDVRLIYFYFTLTSFTIFT